MLPSTDAQIMSLENNHCIIDSFNLKLRFYACLAKHILPSTDAQIL
jgi:hypothetical protein